MRKSIYNGANRFYVYAFLRKSNLTPYYIGKGSGKRAWGKRGRGQVQRPSDNCRIIILQDNMSENDAFALEIERIKFYGRIDLGTGILRNRTDGGEGVSGCSQETRGRMSAVRTGRTPSQETRDRMSVATTGVNNPNYGKTHSPETRVKIAAAWAKRKLRGCSPETRAKLSVAGTGRKCSPETRAKLSAGASGANNPNFRKTRSAETIAKWHATKKRNREAREIM